MSTIIIPEDTRELRQSLTVAKEDRILLINKLGESIYQQTLNGENDQQSTTELTAEILQRDKIIYAFSGELTKRTTKQGHCSNCQQQILQDVKFCGKCGTLNAAYEDKNIVMAECHTCASEIPTNINFCPCCGLKQEG